MKGKEEGRRNEGRKTEEGEEEERKEGEKGEGDRSKEKRIHLYVARKDNVLFQEMEQACLDFA